MSKTKVDELKEVLEKRTDETHEKLLRVMAEFENYKRRTTRETEERIKHANETLLGSLLSVIDDLDRVLDHIPEGGNTEATHIAAGVELLRKNFLTTLEKFGLKEVEALGVPFDPTQHESIAVDDADHHLPDHVTAVHRRGFFLGERLLRPALVTVARKSGPNV